MVTNNFWIKLKKPFFALAPLESVTDIVFRNLIRECCAPQVFFTEFVNTDGLCSRGKDGVIHRLRYDKKEKPIVAQVWGNTPENFLKVAKEILELGFDGIDINCGCSVPKVVKNEACGALIKNPNLVKELFLATKEGVGGKIPVSIKTRIGFRKVDTENWANFLLSLNPDALTIHARCVKEVYSTPARWEEIKKIVDMRNSLKSNTIIIGNGDIQCFQDGIERCKETGVDGVMIGRAAITNPFIFKDVQKDYFLNLDIKEKIKILEKHAKMFNDFWKEEKDFRVMKRFYKTYLSGFKGASALRVKSMQVNTYDDFLKFVKEIKEILK